MKKFLLGLVCLSWTYCAVSQHLPRIIVLSTGGTIADNSITVANIFSATSLSVTPALTNAALSGKTGIEYARNPGNHP